jgi:hypothetical protein
MVQRLSLLAENSSGGKQEHQVNHGHQNGDLSCEICIKNLQGEASGIQFLVKDVTMQRKFKLHQNTRPRHVCLFKFVASKSTLSHGRCVWNGQGEGVSQVVH